jgi:hypothetical protein
VGSHREIRRFVGRIDKDDGLKNRRLAARKMSIGEVLISRTLSVCGLL